MTTRVRFLEKIDSTPIGERNNIEMLKKRSKKKKKNEWRKHNVKSLKKKLPFFFLILF